MTEVKKKTTKAKAPTTLGAKLAAIMGEIKVLQKNGTNSHFKYKFAEAGDVYEMVRPLLAKHNVALMTSMDEVTRGGGHTLIKMTMTFIDGESGDIHESSWFGEAMDKQDKGLNKAATAACKYFLLKTFHIGTSDEVDADADGPIEFASRLITSSVTDFATAEIAIDAASNKGQLDQVGIAIKGKLSEEDRTKIRPIFVSKMNSFGGK